MRISAAKDAARVPRVLRKAGLLLQRTAQLLVPVDSSDLKNSAFTRMQGAGFKAEVNVGFTVGYALLVHENTEMKLAGFERTGRRPDGTKRQGTYWSPQGSQPKFLEEPARNLKDFASFKLILTQEALRGYR